MKKNSKLNKIINNVLISQDLLLEASKALEEASKITDSSDLETKHKAKEQLNALSSSLDRSLAFAQKVLRDLKDYRLSGMDNA